jgi:60 kDa SS-A/Ro ribonucleoprotein
MANKTLFQSPLGKSRPFADTVNEAGGRAYRLEPKHAMAQYAATGCLNATFYASAQDQLTIVLTICRNLDPAFIARTALFARERGYMKDLPALLCAVLSNKGPAGAAELTKVFDRVIDAPKMLRNFVQIMRSGAVGRRSLGSLPKRLVKRWLEARSDEQLFTGSVGQDPSLADVIKMAHPRPASESRQALYAYLIGREYDASKLPELVRRFEHFKAVTRTGGKTEGLAAPDVPFQMLTALELTKAQWVDIARNAPWMMTRMNLNTFLRHGVFGSAEMVELIARRLSNERLIEKARVFPYQLLVAYLSASKDVPGKIREALQDAMEIATKNVPHIAGKVYVFPDVSGSMHSPATGQRQGSTTAARCIDIAALVAAAIVRRNPDAEVIPFESDVVTPDKFRLNPRDSVMTNAQKLASLPAGGTNCSAPLRYLNQRQAKGDLLVYVSDNESWVDSPYYGRFSGTGAGGNAGSATETMNQWAQFKRRSPKAKMVCIDIQPYASTQAKESSDIVNVGGFSDHVFELLADVAAGRTEPGYWVKQIEAVSV